MTALAIGGIANRVLSRTPGRRKARPYTDQARRLSFHEETPQARPWRVFGDRSRGHHAAYRSAALAAFDTKILEQKRLRAWAKSEGRRYEESRNGKMVVVEPLQEGDRRVLDCLIDHHHHATGECYPRIQTIADACARSREGVVDSLRRLKAAGFVRWRRRTKTKEGAAGVAGPQLEQTSNAYYFNWGKMLTGRALAVFKTILTLCLKRIGGRGGPRSAAPITDPALAAAAASFQASYARSAASPPDGGGGGSASG